MAKFFDFTEVGFDVGHAFEGFQVTAISMIDQFQKCGYNEVLIHIDGVMSDPVNLAGAGSNLLVQAIAGWSNKDTALYVSWDGFADSWKYGRWDEMGYKIENFLNQTIKYLGPDTYTEVQGPGT